MAEFWLLSIYYITTILSKQLPVGLVVLSDGMVHFLKIEKNLQILSCGFGLLEYRTEIVMEQRKKS